MNKYQFKEKDYAEEILKSGFTSKYISSELKVLAKYFKYQGKLEEEIKDGLRVFCEQHLKGFNEAVHFKIINSAVKYSMNPKNKLVQINEIEISVPELSFIQSLNITHEFQRVVFTLMVLTKLSREFVKQRDGEVKSNDFYFGGHKNFRELVKAAKITFNKSKKSTVKNIHDVIHMLDDKGIVEIANNGNIKLLFMYEIDSSDNDLSLMVRKFSEIGYYYDLYCDENRVKECENCCVPIKATSNRIRYCKVCSDDNWREYNAKKQREYREK